MTLKYNQTVRDETVFIVCDVLRFSIKVFNNNKHIVGRILTHSLP